MADGNWALAEAKAKLSEVVDKARHEGPQHISRNGKDAAVVLSAEEYVRLKKADGQTNGFARMFTDPKYRILTDEEHDEIFVKTRDRSTTSRPIDL